MKYGIHPKEQEKIASWTEDLLNNKYWDGPQLTFIDYTFMTPVLEALYNKFVTLVLGPMNDFDICTQHVGILKISNTFWDGPHTIYVQQLYLYNIMI